MMFAFVAGISAWPNVWLAAALALALGVVIGPIFIASNVIIHEVADEQMQGKVFSSLEIVIHFAFMVSMLISSKLSEMTSPKAVLMVVAVIFSGLGIAGLLRYKKGFSCAKGV